MKKILIAAVLLSSFSSVRSQLLQPGFDNKEYGDMLAIAFQQFDTVHADPGVPPLSNYHVVYQSPEVGLKNKWAMWYRNDNKIAVISLRGTINDPVSWMGNFYAATVPANGQLQLNDTTSFNYKLANDEKAAVHVGWLVCLGHLAPTIIEQMKIANEKGITEFIVVGHSLGGALAFLTTSYLHYKIESGELPNNIKLKTYCSAGPKPGNTYYAYDFDYFTRGGWAFNIVNAADWVPEMAFSIQRVEDLNTVNPFVHIDDVFKKQKFFVRLVLKHKYNRLKKGPAKAQKSFEKTMGNLAYKMVKKTLPQLKEPKYAHINNFQRAGVPIVLQPNEDYYKKFPNNTKTPFVHHMYPPYAYLLKLVYP